jgi:hypothetical protein
MSGGPRAGAFACNRRNQKAKEFFAFDLIDRRAGTTKGIPMLRSLARLALAFATLVIVIPDTSAHDSWISRGGHRNAAGEWCCGDGDCFVVPKERIMMTGEGYVIVHGALAGVGPQLYESVPFSEAQPSPDGEFWRCKRPDGSRRCFFAPPPAM